MAAADSLVGDGLASPALTRPRRPSVLDNPAQQTRGTSLVAGGATVVVHVALIALAALIGRHVARELHTPLLVTQMIEVELPPAAPTPEPPAPRAAAPAVPAPAARASTPAQSAPPPAAAQAGQVLTAAADIVDFGDTFVAGKGASYAGGVTQAGGTATHAMRNAAARAGGVEGGIGTELGGDGSRAPQLAGGAVWDCPFPPEADDAGVDHAVVTLRVEVAADGRVIAANPSSEPGHGFGREARRCALGKRWAPGLDRNGAPTSAVALVNVRFNR